MADDRKSATPSADPPPPVRRSTAVVIGESDDLGED